MSSSGDHDKRIAALEAKIKKFASTRSLEDAKNKASLEDKRFRRRILFIVIVVMIYVPALFVYALLVIGGIEEQCRLGKIVWVCDIFVTGFYKN